MNNIAGLKRIPVETDRDYWISADGEIWKEEHVDNVGRRWKAHWLKSPISHGYHVVNLGGKNGQLYFVHHLVALTYLGPAPEGKPLVLHKDDNRLNNHYSNLYYGTPQDNMNDKVRNGNARGNTTKGEKHSTAKHTNEQIIAAYKEWKILGGNKRKIADKYGVNYQIMIRLCQKAVWNDVTSQVDRELEAIFHEF